MTSVSVIIPAYNSANTIIRALQSVAAQTLAPLEIIVVDDASTDTTRDLVASFASLSSIPVHVLTQTTNSGPSAARNAGWDAAVGDYIAFLDADDQWHPRKIELQYPVMQSQPKITMSCHGHHFSSSATWADISTNDTKANPVSFHKFLIRNRCATPTVMLKREITERFDSRKRFAEDYLLWMQITANHGPALLLEAQLAHCSNPGYGGTGQSGQMLKMELSEIAGFVTLRKSKVIGFGTLGTVVIWSWIKFGIRLFDSKVMKIRR
jgi:glycosyltransferase involved in cell wall biosynthesis